MVANRLVSLVVLLALALPCTALAQSRGLQVTRAANRVLINKDVGNERWAITYDLGDDTVTGNVYFTSGAPPAFFDCTNTTPQDRDTVTLDCFISNPGCGAEPPSTATCPQEGEWQPIATAPLPRSFFGLKGPECGNGVVESGEACDAPSGTVLGPCPGQADADQICIACDFLCQPREGGRCGDGVVNAGEACDAPDGTVLRPCPGQAGSDEICIGCDLLCVPDATPPTCGNGVVEAGEACDAPDGTLLGTCPGEPGGEQLCIRCDTLCNPAQTCAGFVGEACPEGQLCLLLDGLCDGADIPGTCIRPGTPCPAIFAPVCGCDGQTYSNACVAHSSGVAIDREGPC